MSTLETISMLIYKGGTVMKIRYYVCGIGYDKNDCVTDYDREFGDFDTVEEAQEKFDE